ncbi:O-antigen ligase family protein [Bradyrhizobium sp. LjRoot220]|uniref:O-antigen ligase family protein n=1 Tax=Bradyrhizobium sp. LjRoot220 TaxID=3342284 RepID=UPI003ECC3786
MLIAASIPWSTTAVSVFLLMWFVVLLPTIEPVQFGRVLRTPAALASVALVALAVAGTLWADGPWLNRWQGVAPAAKFLVLPFLLYHFARSKRADWVGKAFLVSCTLLLAYSWIIFVAPEWQFTRAHGFDTTGVPVRNTIDQNQEFVLCCFGLAAASIYAFREQRVLVAAMLAALAAAFLANVLFVALARTSLVYLGVIAVAFAICFFERRAALLVLFGLAAAIPAIWISSPYLRNRIEHVAVEYREYRETNRPTSTGQRLAYWSQSIDWIREAPVVGHGTGSARQLFGAAAIGKQGAWADKIANPHNQTLYVAIQWGVLGCVVLFAMWIAHFRLFMARAGLAAWIGAVVVTQNVTSSLFNSHLFDFAEGWLYVIGVGVAGGVMLRNSAALARETPAKSQRA